MSVDLPAPFSPSSATISPAPTSMRASLRACVPPNRFDTPHMATRGWCEGRGTLSSLVKLWSIHRLRYSQLFPRVVHGMHRRRNMMRLTPWIAAALVLSLVTPAFAQEWDEFVFVEDRFKVNFPGRPQVEA